MSKYQAPEPTIDGRAHIYSDIQFSGSDMWVTPEDSGNLCFETHDDDANTDTTFVLPARDRAALALQLLDGVPGIAKGTPVRNRAKYQVIVDTHTTFAEPTEDGIDRLLQRLAWHLRNGIPGKITEPEGGTFSINEVSEGEVPPRMSETRRHFRYQLPGSEEWHYHSNFKKVQADGGTNIQFQRSYKSEWENA